MKRITIKQIPNLYYKGYIWYSDNPIPQIIDGDFTASLLTDMPFVIEGNLYAEADKISIRIKNIDGVYYISKVDLSEIKTKPTIYIGHDLEGRNFKMIEHWEAKTDPYLDSGNPNEPFKTLKPVWTAFVGFTQLKIKKS